MSTVHGKLRAKKWSVWTEELYSAPGSPGGGGGEPPASNSLSSRGSSPLLPPTEDVMKLCRDDMPTYGQCPSWDGLVLVTCEKCARNVKIEALEAHSTLRHGSKSERAAYGKVLAARSAAALRHCQVRLEPVVGRSLSETPSTTSSTAEKSPLHGVCFGGSGGGSSSRGGGDMIMAAGPVELLSGSSSSTSPQPISFPSSPPSSSSYHHHHHLHGRMVPSPGGSTNSLPVSPAPAIAASGSSSRPAVRVAADSASAPDTRSPSPADMFMQNRRSGHHAMEEEDEEVMEVDTLVGEEEEDGPQQQHQEENDEPQDVEMVSVAPLSAAPVHITSSSSSPYHKLGQGGSTAAAAVGGASVAADSLRFLVGEEADSTTAHNVISIPDTEDIPNIEIGIISEGQVLDSINTKYNVSLLKSESSPVDSTTTTHTTAPGLVVKSLSTGSSNSSSGTSAAGPGIRFGGATATPSVPRIQVLTSTADQQQQQHRPAGNSNSTILQLSLPAQPGGTGQPRIISLPIRASSSQQQQLLQQQQQQQQPEKMDVDNSHHQQQQQHVVAPTHYITVSPLSKTSPKKPVVGGMKTGAAGLEKKAGNSREREYDPNKHCGVWDGDAKRNCTRSLTCKSHSVYLKRKVINRSGTFDELLAAHKADKEMASGGGGQLRSGGDGQGSTATVVVSGPAESNLAAATESQSILARRLQLAPGTSPSRTWDHQPSAGSVTPTPAQSSSVLKPALIRRPFLQQQQQQQQLYQHQTQLSVSAKEFYCDENLHFATEHPKPLAVCTFGGKRVGSIFLADRSRILTRKVMKIAISSSGVPRLQSVLKADQLGLMGRRVTVSSGGPAAIVTRPQQQQQQQSSLPYLVSLQNAPATAAAAVVGSRGGLSIGGVGGGRVGTLQIAATGIQATTASHYVVQDAFKTDIQDFKGGIKFELSRNIHQILPQSDLG